MTERKNKRSKQVCHCLLNICEQAVNLVTKKSTFLKPARLSILVRQAIKPIYLSRLSTPQSSLSLSNHLLTSRNCRKNLGSLSLSLSCSLCKQPLFVRTTLSPSPTYLGPMASTGTKSSITGSSVQRTTQARRSLLPTVLSGETTANGAPQSAMGFENLAPLAIT